MSLRIPMYSRKHDHVALIDEDEIVSKSMSAKLLDCLKYTFSRKKKKERAMQMARTSCERAMQILSDKEKELQTLHDQYEMKLLQAMQKQNIDQAKQCLKYKKYYKKQLDKIKIHSFNVESQMVCIEETNTNRGVMDAMKNVTVALKRAGKQDLIADIDNTMETLQENMEDVQECSHALTAQGALVHPDMPTDDDLEEEVMILFDMKKPEPVQMPTPTPTPTVKIPTFPDVPTNELKQVVLTE